MTTDPLRAREALEDRTGLVATALGALITLTGLGVALVMSLAINHVAHQQVGAGIALLAVAITARWLVAELLDRWFARVARQLRQFWRSLILEFFLVPTTASVSSPIDLADAVETIADEPRLKVVRASAQTSILSLGIVWWAGGWQALGIVLVLLVAAVPLYQRAGSRAATLDVQYRERRARLGERQLELLVHAPELRALGVVEYASGEIAALSTSEHQVALLAIRTALGSSLVTEFLSGVSVGLVAMSVGFGLLDGRISLLRAVIAVLVTSEFFGHVRRYGVEFHRREAITAASERLVVPASAASFPAEVLETFELVTHAHPQSGERVAVLGASGAGKTTLAHTLLGWRTPLGGRVHRTSDAVGYVSADTKLVEGSLDDNLRLGGTFPEVRLREALSGVGLIDERFADLQRLVSADGEGFSSGERVRLLVARALLHGPGLLILDDVAGLLDGASRDAVRDELARHLDVAIIEIAVDDALFISATTTVRLS
jgi:ABC-type transport system involved in cytochrome bd biosynthesis fused ATPase/permease subunit